MQNPFTDFKTNEMPIELIQEYFTPPKNIDKIYTPNAMFITGQRGSGKTMFMRYIENNQRCRYNSDEVEYLGVYYRFNRMVFSSYIMDTDLFLHHVIITFLQCLVNRLSALMLKCGKQHTHFSGFSDAVFSVFYDKNDNQCNSYEDLSNYLEEKRLDTMKYIRNPKRIEKPLICDYSGCLPNIVEQLHKEPWLSHVTLLFLLDEYENLNTNQRRAVNGLIKSASYGYTFKVFYRPMKLDSQVMDSDEHLMVQHDIMTVDFYEEIIGGDDNFPFFMTNILRKRLKLYFEKNCIPYQDEDLDIEKLLIPIEISDEFEAIKRKKGCIPRISKSIQQLVSDNEVRALQLADNLSDDVFNLRLFQSILEKKIRSVRDKGNSSEVINNVVYAFLNKTKEYRGWVENYRVSILYLLCFENQCSRQVAGWKNILKVSCGNTRNAINILFYIFDNADLEETKPLTCFSVERQTEAVNMVARKYYEDIIRVPVLGKPELLMIQYYGSLFQIIHKDSTMQKWEVSHFVINKKSGLLTVEDVEKRTEDVLNAAITWGHLLERRANKNKTEFELSSDLAAYQLHPLLSVYFGISWRQKQRYETSLDELYSASFDLRQRQVFFRNNAKKYIRNADLFPAESVDINQIYEQQALPDF